MPSIRNHGYRISHMETQSPYALRRCMVVVIRSARGLAAPDAASGSGRPRVRFPRGDATTRSDNGS